jgi:hypothetical protein
LQLGDDSVLDESDPGFAEIHVDDENIACHALCRAFPARVAQAARAYFRGFLEVSPVVAAAANGAADVEPWSLAGNQWLYTGYC